MSEDNERDLYVITKHTRDPREQKFKLAALERHFVQLPHYNEKGWYTDGISMNAFRRRMQKRHIKSREMNGNWVAQAMAMSFWFRVEMKCDFDADREIWAKAGVVQQEAVEFHHASLKEFYEAIGYNPKLNKLAVEPVKL